MRYCGWCGAEIGESDFNEPVAPRSGAPCSESECARQVANLYRQEREEQEREEAQYAAEQDD